MRNTTYSSTLAGRVVPLTVLAALAVTSVAACSSSDDKTGSTATGSPASSATKTSKISGDTGDLKDPVGAIASVSEFECKADGSGVWSANLKVSNTTDQKSSYLVRVSVVKKKTSEVVGSRTKTVKLGAGATETLGFGDFAEGKGKGLQCLPRAIRGE